MSSEIDLSSKAFKCAPHETLHAFAQGAPVVRVKLPVFGKVWLVTQHTAVIDMLKSQHHFAADARQAGFKTATGVSNTPKALGPFQDNLLNKDDPDHRQLRKQVDQAFLKRGVNSMRPAIAQIADDLLDQVSPGKPFDLVKAYARPLPLIIICDLLGLPDEDRSDIIKWCSPLTGGGSWFDALTLSGKLKKLTAYLTGLIAARRETPDTGLISHLANLGNDSDFNQDDMLAMIILLFIAGHANSTHTISLGVLTLLQHKEQLNRLIDDWTRAPQTVDEILRYACPEQMTKPRFATKDVSFHGAEIRRGDKVVACLAAANLDPIIFEDPLCFHPDRTPNKHLAFGAGGHHCLGAQLARISTEIALERLFTRWPDLTLVGQATTLDWLDHVSLRGVEKLPMQTASTRF